MFGCRSHNNEKKFKPCMILQFCLKIRNSLVINNHVINSHSLGLTGN